MSNELAIPGSGDVIVNHVGRLEELERRVRSLDDDPPDDAGGCCGVLCCDDESHTTVVTGDHLDECSVTLESSPGDATRLAFSAHVVVQAVSSGLVVFDVAALVDGQPYLSRPSWQQTLAANDVVTVPLVNTIDTNATAPVCAVRIRNLGTPSISVLGVNLRVDVYGVRDGSLACGHSAGTG